MSTSPRYTPARAVASASVSTSVAVMWAETLRRAPSWIEYGLSGGAAGTPDAEGRLPRGATP